MEEPASPRPLRGAALAEAMREDLDTYGVIELKERIASLEREIGRTEKALDKKQAGRNAADALFSFGGG